jgi:glutamyl-tRNA reductase
MDSGPKIGACRKEFQEVARSELARQRQRLGPLTPEQERAVEALLVSTANKLSHSVITKLRNC